jgi:hypothetical protein
MFAADLRAVRAPRGLAKRLQPAPLALRPSVLSITQRPNATLSHKKDRAFTPQNAPAPHAHTERRATRFPSAPCALFAYSLCALVQSPYDQLLSFHALPHSLKKAPGIGAPPQKTSFAFNELRTLQNANVDKSEYKNSELIARLSAEPAPQPRMRQPHLCVIVSGRPPVSAWRVSRIIKTQSEVHSL